jgi:hypothetical protein
VNSDLPQKLPAIEWKFDDIPDDEIEACFWWEYLRTGLDTSLRAELAGLWRADPRTLAHGSAKLVKSIRGRFHRPKLLLAFFHLSLNHRLLADDSVPVKERAGDYFFEQCAWMSIPPLARRSLKWVIDRGCAASVLVLRQKSKRPAAESVIHEFAKAFQQMVAAHGSEKTIELVEQIQSYRRPLPNDDGLTIEQTQEWMEAPPSCSATDFIAEQPSTVQVTMDLRCLNIEILEEIERFLVQYRLPEWPEPKHRFLEASHPKLPRKTMRADLGNLGVKRRHDAGCRWCDFEAVYSTQKSDLSKCAAKAERVVAWMRDGDPTGPAKRPAKKPLLSAGKKASPKKEESNPL